MCNKINKELLRPRTENGLACPFAKADPDRYADQASCHLEKGWPHVKDIGEHIWRFHSPKYRCEYCGYRWTAVKNRTVVQGLRDAHIPGCREQNGGTLHPCEPTDLELLSEAQQSDFEKVLKIRDIEKKFAALYRACGKPEPETYHVKPLAPSQTTNSSSLLDGFNRPDADPHLTAQQSQTTLSQTQLEQVHRQSQVNDAEYLTPSGADNFQVDHDSAYYSRDHDEPESELPMSPSQIFGSSYFVDSSAPLGQFGACLDDYPNVPQEGFEDEIDNILSIPYETFEN